ncbi:immunoglobulin-binding protein 1 [Ornithorhynchus anatinus]|uniref:immunoglobulin-binding protein 1 n=1 Tax=Ornithorhynchus anatinus TaxID=9258 RepID=UPI0019D4DCD4|nr:immunoglobulin-binding protein 1 [Ornithorhynchus anatinus]
MAAEEAEASRPRLPELLEQGWRLLDEVEASSEPAAARQVQDKVKLGLSLLDQAARMVEQLDLFSRNEELEEVASADLKYLLVPALRGALTLKQVVPGQRLEQVQRARAHFADFLKRCQDYQLTAAEPPAARPAGPPGARPGLVAAAAHRRAKIERYKQKKEAESQLAALRGAVDGGRADEEQLRAYYLLHVQKWVGTSLDEIESIDQEAEILRGRDQLGQQVGGTPGSPTPPPMKPFVLTRDAAQAKVFGLGYPSLATMTVNEWYDQHEKWGALPDQGIPGTPAGAAEEEERDQERKKEEEEEEEEEEKALQKARGWDEWKDTHPRGYGNRQNMG